MEPKVKDQLDRLLSIFKSQSLPEVCAEAFTINGNKPMSKWSFSNKIITLLNGTMDARGFRQWNDAGRYVKKGSKAFYILAPRMSKVERENKETGKKELIPILTGFLGIPVFRYEDTDGQPLPDVQPKVLPELFDIAQKIGVKVEYREYNGGRALAYFSPSSKEIVMYTHDSKTFYHELTHAVQNHIDKVMPTNKESSEYALNEVVAEVTGATIASMYGASSSIDSSAFHYIKMYARLIEKHGSDNEKVYRAIMRVLSKVEDILNFIFPVKEPAPVKETITA